MTKLCTLTSVSRQLVGGRLERGQIQTTVAFNAAHAVIAKQELNGSHVDAFVEHLLGKGGAQQVRVVAAPGFAVVSADNFVITPREAQRVGVTVNHLPDAGRRTKLQTSGGDKQRLALAGPGFTAAHHPFLQQTLQRRGDRAVSSAPISLNNHDKTVIVHGPQREGNEFMGLDAGLIQNPHDHVITKPHKRADVWLGQQLSHFFFMQHARQLLRRFQARWELFRQVLCTVTRRKNPSIERPNGRNLTVIRRNTAFFPAINCPLMDVIL